MALITGMTFALMVALAEIHFPCTCRDLPPERPGFFVGKEIPVSVK